MTEKVKTISSFIIAGGESKRFGEDKVHYKYRGKPLIQHVIDKMEIIFEEISIVSSNIEMEYSPLTKYPLCGKFIAALDDSSLPG